MNKSTILVETTTTNTTTEKLRPRSGSWSGYQYYQTQSYQQQKQQQQQQQPSSNELKPIKQTFLTKFIQKRPIPTPPLQHEPQPIPTMQPMLSTPLLKRQDLKKKKGGSLGRFLKKFNKNASDKSVASDNTSLEISNEDSDMDIEKNNDKYVNNNININNGNVKYENTNYQQSMVVNDRINDAIRMPQQTHKPTVHENFGHVNNHHQPIVPTLNNKMISDINPQHEHHPHPHHHHHHHQFTNNISTDDIHLNYQYNYKPDVNMYTTLVPRSTSFDVNRTSHSPPPIRLFTPLNQKPLIKSTKTNLINNNNNNNNNDNDTSKKSALEEDSLVDDDDDTNDSLDSDLDEEDEENHIRVEKLSKRLSGGHYGSAGGLIVNTLSLSEIANHTYIKNNNDNEEQEEEEEEEKEEDKEKSKQIINNEEKEKENDDDNHHTVENKSQPSISPSFASPSSPSSSSSPSLSSSKENPSVIINDNDTSKVGHAGNNELEFTTNPKETLKEHNKDGNDNDDNNDHDNNNHDNNDHQPIINNNNPDIKQEQQIEKTNEGIELEEDENNNNDNISMENKTEDLARRILELDDTVYPDLEHVAEWIGDGSLASNQILKHYMTFFDFSNQKLEDSLRQLCGKLPMKAESQQIDRILEEFSKRFWDCNSQNGLYGSSDVIHAIVYSLVLLNTDLHIAQGEHKKMSRPAFVRNTMDAIRSQLDTLNNDDSLLLEEETKHSSCISLQSTNNKTPQEWVDLKRSSSYRSTYSQQSINQHDGIISSTIKSIGKNKAWESNMETLLKQMYNSIRHRQLVHPTFKNNIVDQSDIKRRNSINDGSNSTTNKLGFKRGVGSMMWKAARESLFLSDSHSHSTTTLTTEVDYAQPLSPRSAVSSLSGTFPRRRSISSIRSGFSHHSQYTNHGSHNPTTTYQAVASLLHHSNLPTSFTSSAPYYKEGLIVRKHLMERANHKARQRDWKECFMVVDRGEIRMYRLDGQNNNYRRNRSNNNNSNNNNNNNNNSLSGLSNGHSLRGMMSRGSLATVSETDQASTTTNEMVLGGGDWLANAQMIGEIDLKHTLANSLPSGYNRQRQHAFALQQSNGGVYLFQVGSAEQVLEWVSTCNYWAARESKEPLLGGVGNLEYGWGSCLDGIKDDDDDDNDDDDKNNDNDSKKNHFIPISSSSSSIVIHQWQPPLPPMGSSVLGEVEQLEALHQHIKSLNKELDNHRDIKHKMEKKFPRKTSDHVCAMSNFENKTQYLLHEIIKYQNYCDAIEKSLDLQNKAINEKKQSEDSKLPSSEITV